MQWMYYETFETLPENADKLDFKPTGCRYDDFI